MKIDIEPDDIDMQRAIERNRKAGRAGDSKHRVVNASVVCRGEIIHSQQSLINAGFHLNDLGYVLQHAIEKVSLRVDVTSVQFVVSFSRDFE